MRRIIVGIMFCSSKKSASSLYASHDKGGCTRPSRRHEGDPSVCCNAVIVSVKILHHQSQTSLMCIHPDEDTDNHNKSLQFSSWNGILYEHWSQTDMHDENAELPARLPKNTTFFQGRYPTRKWQAHSEVLRTKKSGIMTSDQSCCLLCLVRLSMGIIS